MCIADGGAGLYTAGFGPLLWGVVKHNGVKEYFENKLEEAARQRE